MESLRRRRTRKMNNDINVVPYIDVMLVLLVIFMVTAPMITPGLIDLPTVGSASEVPATPIEVQIDKDNEISIRLRDSGSSFITIDKANLVAELKSMINQDTPVVISADGKVAYESVMEIMDMLRNSGINKLGLLVNQQAVNN